MIEDSLLHKYEMVAKMKRMGKIKKRKKEKEKKKDTLNDQHLRL